MRRKRPSHATLVAYLALFVALGGTVYAASRINGHSIRAGSTPGNRLKSNSVGGKQVNEPSLNALGFIHANAKSVDQPCIGPGGSDSCASTTLKLRHPSRIIGIANGGWYAVSPPPGNGGVNQLLCRLAVDGDPGAFIGGPPAFGETSPASTSSLTTTPFGFAQLSHGKVKAGKHSVQLICDGQADQVEQPQVVAFAISGG